MRSKSWRKIIKGAVLFLKKVREMAGHNLFCMLSEEDLCDYLKKERGMLEADADKLLSKENLASSS